jgi:glycosyltransferase involved in cell wall biosynthesis
MKRHDVAIYAPFSGMLYDRAQGRAGGAERQMVLLAQALSGRGHQIAHIVYPVRQPVPLPGALTLVYRRGYTGDHRLVGRVAEAMHIWRALREADARVVVVRTGTPVVGLAALFCRLRRRRLIFSSANNSDFTLERLSDRWYRRPLYRLGVRLADTVVVQSKDQVALAEHAFPDQWRIVRIPSFAEAATPTPPRASEPIGFLWIGRLVDYKRPLRYVELARLLPEAPFVMIPVPDEPAAFRLLEELRAAARDVANLTLLDPVPHARTVELIGRAVAVVNTARLEGMPNVFLEAWSRGVPVLTLEFDPDGVVAQHRLGVAAKGSWEDFLAGAKQLWSDRDDREEFSKRARAYIEQFHSIESVGARWSELIEQLAPRS